MSLLVEGKKERFGEKKEGLNRLGRRREGKKG